MQDREDPPQYIFTVKDCGNTEFNGTYYVDIDHDGGFVNGKRCYRKNGVGNAGSECTIEWGSGKWYMTKNYGNAVFCRVFSTAEQPPTSGWELYKGSGSPPQLVYEVSNVLNFYLILYG